MKKETQKTNTLEARRDRFYQLKGELTNWLMLSDEEQKRMDSVIRAIKKYLELLEKELEK